MGEGEEGGCFESDTPGGWWIPGTHAVVFVPRVCVAPPAWARGHLRANDSVFGSDRTLIDIACIFRSQGGAIRAVGRRRHGEGGARPGDWGFGLDFVVVGVLFRATSFERKTSRLANHGSLL